MRRAFAQVDVFAGAPLGGNPVAVVLDGEGLSSEEMQRFTDWTNLSEATFVLPATDPRADYRVRIFSTEELPFAGHPSLGTCHAWLEAGGQPRDGDVVVQECGAGLISVRRMPDGFAFAEPPLRRSGPVEEEVVARVARLLGIDHAQIVDTQWVDNGPGWVGVLLETPEAVLSLRPALVDLLVGVAAPYPAGSPEAFEVRAFFPRHGATVEDPVTGSLNASLARWLITTGRATAPYVARQGTALGRAGRAHISTDDDGTIWVGGATVTRIRGEVEL